MNVNSVTVMMDGLDSAQALPGSFTGDPWDGFAVLTGGASVLADIVTPYGTVLQGLRITNGAWTRKFSWNSRWSAMRLLALLRINSTASLLQERLFFGVCSGTAKGFGAADTVQAIGMMLGMKDTEDGGFEKVTDITPTYYWAKWWSQVNKIGSNYNAVVRSDGIKASSNTQGHVVQQSQYWSCLLVELVRDIDRRISIRSGTTAVGDLVYQFSASNILSEALKPNSISTSAADHLTAGMIGNNKFTPLGELDSLNLYWSGSDPIEVGAIVARRVY